MFERSDPKIGRFDHEKPSKRNPLFLTEHSVNHSTAMLVSSLKITIYQRFSPSLLLQNLGEIYGHVRKLNTRNNHEGH